MLYSLLIILIIISLYLLQRRRKKATGKALVPPGPPGLPLIGNLHQFATATNLHFYLWNLSQKYGPLMHMKLGSKPAIVVSSARLAREVMKTHDSSFCSRPPNLGQQKLSYDYMEFAFTPYGDYWREARKITVIHLLSLRKTQSFRPVREYEVSQMMKRIQGLACSRQVVNLSELTMEYATSLICRIAFGKIYDGHKFAEMLRDTQAMIAGFFISDYIPSLSWVDKLSGLIGRLEATHKKMDAFLEELIQDHLDSIKDKKIDKGYNVVDVLVQLMEEKSCSIDLNWNSIKALLMIIFVAGTDTSAATLVWTMTALIKAPAIMKKVQEEVRTSVSPKGHVDEDDLQKLPYLKAAIREAFRLYPPVPMLVPRESMEKCILEGYSIQPKTMVFINGWAIGRDPEYWENPNEFLPERFLNTDKDVIGQDFGVVPFGAGRRICPGIHMGLASLELAMANLVYSFDWELPIGVEAQSIINTDVLPGITMHKKDQLLLLPTPI